MNKRTRVAFLDILLIVILILIVILKTQENESSADEYVPPGSVVVQVEWPPDMDVDMDLWVQAPGDVPVGYSNKGGVYFNLLRDDVGNASDTTVLNFEVAYSRGQPVGEYIVNLHLYRNNSGVTAIPAHVEILMRIGTKKYVTIFKRDVVLTFRGQEITVQRFTLDEKSNIVGKSLIPKALRSAKNG